MLAVPILALSGALEAVTLGEREAATERAAIRSDAADALSGRDGYELLDVRFVDDGSLPVAGIDRVEVVVGHPTGDASEAVLSSLRDAIAAGHGVERRTRPPAT